MDSTLTASLPMVFDDGILIVDLNMGDGSFIKSCFDRHIAMAYGFEERDDLFIEAENKLADYRDYCKLYRQRISRSDKNNDTEATRFDFIISHLPPVDMLKINSGKQIYPILMTSKYLDNIGSIIGSVSGIPTVSNAPKTSPVYSVGQLRHPKMSDLKKYLEIKGFNVEVAKDRETFVAYKNGATPIHLSNTPK